MKQGRKTNASKGLPKRKGHTFRLLPEVKAGIDTLVGGGDYYSQSHVIESLVMAELEKVRGCK